MACILCGKSIFQFWAYCTEKIGTLDYTAPIGVLFIVCIVGQNNTEGLRT